MPDRYRLIDRKALMKLLDIIDSDQFTLSHRIRVEEALRIKGEDSGKMMAVGISLFVEQVKTDLGASGLGRKIISNANGHELRESQVSYDGYLGGEKRPLRYKTALRDNRRPS